MDPMDRIHRAQPSADLRRSKGSTCPQRLEVEKCVSAPFGAQHHAGLLMGALLDADVAVLAPSGSKGDVRALFLDTMKSTPWAQKSRGDDGPCWVLLEGDEGRMISGPLPCRNEDESEEARDVLVSTVQRAGVYRALTMWSPTSSPLKGERVLPPTSLGVTVSIPYVTGWRQWKGSKPLAVSAGDSFRLTITNYAAPPLDITVIRLLETVEHTPNGTTFDLASEQEFVIEETVTETWTPMEGRYKIFAATNLNHVGQHLQYEKEQKERAPLVHLLDTVLWESNAFQDHCQGEQWGVVEVPIRIESPLRYSGATVASTVASKSRSRGGAVRARGMEERGIGSMQQASTFSHPVPLVAGVTMALGAFQLYREQSRHRCIRVLTNMIKEADKKENKAKAKRLRDQRQQIKNRTLLDDLLGFFLPFGTSLYDIANDAITEEEEEEEPEQQLQAPESANSQAAETSASLPHDRDPVQGDTLRDHYKLGDKLGEGGFGVVFEAMDTHIWRPVVVKILRLQGDEAKQRFGQEAEILRNCEHENIVQIKDYDHCSSGTPFIVMERFEGRTLHDRMHSVEGRMSELETLELAGDVLEALIYLHTHQPPIIHLDIKPSNIFLCTTRTRPPPRFIAKLLDFGIAKFENDTMLYNGCNPRTPNYASPEQYAGRKLVGCQSDLYSLGAVLYECVTGHMPRCRPEEIGRGLMDMGISERFASAVANCLQTSPQQRFASAVEMRKRLLNERDVPTVPESNGTNSYVSQSSQTVLESTQATETIKETKEKPTGHIPVRDGDATM